MLKLPFILKESGQIASFRRKYEAKNVLFAWECINVVILKLFMDRLLINRKRDDRVSELPRNKRRHAVSKARIALIVFSHSEQAAYAGGTPRKIPSSGALYGKERRNFPARRHPAIPEAFDRWKTLFKRTNTIDFVSELCWPTPPRGSGGSFKRMQTGKEPGRRPSSLSWNYK